MWRASNLGLDETWHPKIQILGESCERFVRSCLRDYRERGTWYVVAGNTGCGKSHVADRIRRYYDTRRISAWALGWIGAATNIPGAAWVHWPTACELRDDAFAEWFEEASGARLDIIDDFGAESERFKNGANDSRLLRLLEICDPRRGRWLFATTNVPPSEWATRYDQRIADRLRGANRLTLFEVPSFRVKGTR